MSSSTKPSEGKQSIYEANLIKQWLDRYSHESLEITQFADIIFIRPKGDSIKFAKMLQKYLKIAMPKEVIRP